MEDYMNEIDYRAKLAIQEEEDKNRIINTLHNFIKSTIDKKRYDKEQADLIATSIYTASKKYKLNPFLVGAMCYEESDPKWYKDCVSPKGARGLMQIMPVWDGHLFVYLDIKQADIFNIKENIMAGCHILREYLDMGGDDLNWALNKYSGGGGETYVSKVRSAMERIKEAMK